MSYLKEQDLIKLSSSVYVKLVSNEYLLYCIKLYTESIENGKREYMIRVKNITIDSIPVIELVLEENDQKSVPTVFFYHGWTNTKESVLVNGYELAKKGFRAVLPEAHLHGERDEEGKGLEDQSIFWDVVEQNVRELPLLFKYYVSNGLTDPEKFGVSGLSMGGITTCAALTQYEFIHSAVVLMGSPSPVPFTEWLLTSKQAYEQEGTPEPNEVKEALTQLKSIALNEQPEKIAGRPVHFWHGTKDEVVPFHFTEEFIEQISMQPYAESVSFSVGHGVGHKVPYSVSVQMAEFFEKHLTASTKVEG